MPEPLAPESPGVAEAMAAAFKSNPADGVPKPAPAAPTAAPEAKPKTPAPEVKPTAAAPEVKPVAKKEFTDAEIEAARKEKPDHKAWKILDSVKAKHSATETQLKAELQKLQARPETPANDAKIKELEQRIAEREKLIEERDQKIKERDQRLEEADFTRSEEYLTKYYNPYHKERAKAIQEVKGLVVTFAKDGETHTRQATEADFLKAFSLPPSEQDEYIQETFGKSAWRVMNRINEMNRIKDASEAAVQDFSTNYEKNKTARELETKRQREAYEKEVAEAHNGFQKDPELGRYVSESEDDPDGTKLYKSELERFDSFKTANPTAADAATVRARFAMTPRLLHVAKQQQAKIASLEDEIAKFRGADPGGAVKTATGGDQPKEELGVEGTIKSFNWSKAS